MKYPVSTPPLPLLVQPPHVAVNATFKRKVGKYAEQIYGASERRICMTKWIGLI